jgi:predicted lactoylglutathione lyase
VALLSFIISWKENKMNRVVVTFVIAVAFFAALGMVRLQLLMLETKTSEFILQSVVAILLSDALYRNLKKTE